VAHIAETGRSYWSWTDEEWADLLGQDQDGFCNAVRLGGRRRAPAPGRARLPASAASPRALISPVYDLTHRLHWSHWRRRHQARARQCHYKQQAALRP
jgi:hypothetical protein